MTPEELEKIRKLCDKNFKVGTHPKTICIDEMIYLGGCAGGMLDLIDQQAAEIKRLEDALVEERAGIITATRLVRQLDAVWIIEEKTDEDRQTARDQLRAEGVIR
jgi:hypothetical protein